MAEQKEFTVADDPPPATGAECTVELEACVAIADLARLREGLAEALETGRPVALEGGSVDRVDAAALQLLCAFFQAARAADVPCRWHAASDPLVAAARLCGLDGHLGLSG